MLIIGSSVLLAQPLIEVIPEVLEVDTINLGSTEYYGVFDPVIVKNSGSVDVELGLSASFDYRHVDTVGHYGDTVAVWAHFGESLSFSWIPGSLDVAAQFPRFCGDGYFGSPGISLGSGDSVFLQFRVQAHTCPVSPLDDTLRIHLYGRNGTEIDSTDIRKAMTFSWGGGYLPPASLVVDSISVTAGSEEVFFSTMEGPWELCLDYYQLYRDTVALFYPTQLDSNNMLPDHFYSTTLVDSFSDTLWPHYWGSSKGIGDTLVNLFYVGTGIDTGTGGYGESSSPSWCLCEYDQSLKADPVHGSFNLISIPCYDERYTTSSDLSEFGICLVQEWNPITQTWSLHGHELLPGIWSPDMPLQVSHVYRVSGNDMEPFQLFSTFKPGIVASSDTSYTLYSSSIVGDRNIIMLPFNTCYIDGINSCSTLDASIVGLGGDIYRVERWNNTTQTWSVVGFEIVPGIWGWDDHLRPGLPYRIWVDTDSPINWPIGAR